MTKERGAVLQFEIDRERWRLTSGDTYRAATTGEKPSDRLYYMAQTAVNDTLLNGGTFVLVVSETKVTMVQRPEATELDEEKP
jgi:hypothetical protein